MDHLLGIFIKVFIANIVTGFIMWVTSFIVAVVIFLATGNHLEAYRESIFPILLLINYIMVFGITIKFVKSTLKKRVLAGIVAVLLGLLPHYISIGFLFIG
jgi:hypothetical protein